MIWYEIDAGAIEAPTGGNTASSSVARSVQVQRQHAATDGLLTEGATQTTATFLASDSSTVRATSSYKEDAVAGTVRRTNEETGQTVMVGSFQTNIDHGGGNGIAQESSESLSSETMFSEEGRTSVNVAIDGAMYVTVVVSRTISESWSSSFSSAGSTTRTYVSEGATLTTVDTASDAGSSVYTFSTVITHSSTESHAGAASWHAQTTITGTCIHHGTTTCTATYDTIIWTVVDDVPTTTLVPTTGLSTTTADYTVNATFTTTITAVIPARHARQTVVIADCGRHLLVAHGQSIPGFAHAADWYFDEGTLVILSPFIQTSYTATTLTASHADSVISTASHVTAAELYGSTVSINSTDEAHMTGHTVAAGGVVIYDGGGFLPVGYAAAATALDFPTFGESGPMTLRATGACVLRVTITPGYGRDVSYSTLSAAESATASWTFRAGADIKVDPCVAYAPSEYAVNDFYPWYVAEVNCRDAPLRACG